MSRWKNFSRAEFERNGNVVPDSLLANLDELVIGVLDPIRDKWGGPIKIVSGYRSPAYNKRIGGAEQSQHMFARAADIQPGDPTDAASLHSVIRHMYAEGKLPKLGGLGLYKTWVHVDTHRIGRLRQWGI